MTTLVTTITHNIEEFTRNILKATPKNIVSYDNIVYDAVMGSISEFNKMHREAGVKFMRYGKDTQITFRAFSGVNIGEFSLNDLVKTLLVHLSHGHFKAITEFKLGTNSFNNPKLVAKILHVNGRVSTLRLPVMLNEDDINNYIHTTASQLNIGSRVISKRNATNTYLNRYSKYCI